MQQVAALPASLEKVDRVLLRNHLETCVSAPTDRVFVMLTFLADCLSGS
jgi:DNA-binding FrmR family transcriptional regulator